MSKLKVLAVPSDNHGVGKYRILDPYKFIGNHFSEDIHVDIVFTVEDNDEIFNDYDIVVFHSFIHKLPVERNLERISWLRNKGIKVVMDIDEAHKHEEVILIASIGLVNHLIYSHKDEEARGGECGAVLQEVFEL